MEDWKVSIESKGSQYAPYTLTHSYTRDTKDIKQSVCDSVYVSLWKA